MRELAILIYLLGFKGLFTLFKRFPLKNKVTFIVSFPDNSMSIYKELQKQNIDIEVVFLCHHRCFNTFKKINALTYLVESRHLLHTLIGIYHLATSKQVVVDNYYGFLAATTFKKGVKCTQIWHAAGAIKQFGAKDKANVNRTHAAQERFKKVYNKFDTIVVGSNMMASIFQKAFLATEASFLKVGIPRTDFFFNDKKLQQVKTSFYQNNPILKEKKVILYAPTFRKGEDEVNHLQLDIQKMVTELPSDYVLLIKFHPAVQCTLNIIHDHPNFAFDYSDYPNINELLIITDILITDYSSIPMEFSLLRRKMIFFAYDLADYKQKNGLWEDFETSVPGPVAKHTDEVIEAILNEETNLLLLDAYAKKWMHYCDGYASERLVKALF